MSERTPRAIVFTDLDGTLLDATTYDPGPARTTLARLAARGIPVVPATSKTWAETRAWIERLGLDGPAVVENGGAISLPGRGDTPAEIVTPGPDYVTLRAALAAIAVECGVALAGFGDWDTVEIARRTGLAPDEADRARLRHADEPFLAEPALDREATERMVAAAERRGLAVERGGRFFHLHGPADKGTGVRRVTAWYALPGLPVPVTVGIGDSANDRALLAAVDVAIALPGASGEVDPALARLPGVRHVDVAGPRGFAAAIDAWLTTFPEVP